jgi:hypothetical protein
VTLDPSQLRINVLQPPGDWVAPRTWLDELNLLLRGQVYLRDGSLNLFMAGMNRLLEQKGISRGTDRWPSLAETRDFFGGMRFGPKNRNANFLESLLNRLGMICEAFEYTARVANSDMLARLTNQSVIFCLHGLAGVPLQFLVSYLLLWLSRFREGAPVATPHMVIIEEAHMLASQQSRIDIGESVLCRTFRTARKRGIALVLCDQVPSELPPAVLGNLGCRLVLRLVNSRCIGSLAISLGLKRDQAETIPELKPRQLVVQYALHPTPFAVQVPRLRFPKHVDRKALTQAADAVLAPCHWQRDEADSQPGRTTKPNIPPAPDDLAGDPLLVMVRICEAPAEPIEQRCRTLRMDRARELRARAHLVDRGLVEQVSPTVAGKFKFFRPTDKGEAWAQRRGFGVKKYKSGIVHEYILTQVELGIGRVGHGWYVGRNSSIGHERGL